MNACQLLPDELRKRIAHLTIDEITQMADWMERDLTVLRIFLRAASLGRRRVSRRRKLPPPTRFLN
jgi:hypothetical protein